MTRTTPEQGSSIEPSQPSRAKYRTFRERPISYACMAGAAAAFVAIVAYSTIQDVLFRPYSKLTTGILLVTTAALFLWSSHRVLREGILPSALGRWRFLDTALWTLTLFAANYFVLIAVVTGMAYVTWRQNFVGLVPFLSAPGIQWSIVLLVGLPLLALGAIALRRWTRSAIRRHSQQCVRCGYDLRASPHRCPECGTPTGTSAAL
jgi:hypothetical protein